MICQLVPPAPSLERAPLLKGWKLNEHSCAHSDNYGTSEFFLSKILKDSWTNDYKQGRDLGTIFEVYIKTFFCLITKRKLY